MKKNTVHPARTAPADAERVRALHGELVALIAELELEVDACVAAGNVQGLLHIKAQLVTVRDLPFEDKERLVKTMTLLETERSVPIPVISEHGATVGHVTPPPITVTLDDAGQVITSDGAPPVSESVTRKAQRAQ